MFYIKNNLSSLAAKFLTTYNITFLIIVWNLVYRENYIGFHGQDYMLRVSYLKIIAFTLIRSVAQGQYNKYIVIKEYFYSLKFDSQFFLEIYKYVLGVLLYPYDKVVWPVYVY